MSLRDQLSSSAASSASAATGLLRDASIVTALGVGAASDSVFGAFAVAQASYVLLFGGTAAVRYQRDVALRPGLYEASRLLRQRPSSRMLSVVAPVTAAGLYFGTRASDTPSEIAIFVLILIATFIVRPLVELRSAWVVHHISVAAGSWPAVLQNVATVAWIAVLLAAPITVGPSLVLTGYLLGYIAQGFVVTRKIRERSLTPSSPDEGTTSAFRALGHRFDRSLAIGLLAVSGMEIAEPLVLAGLGDGVVTTIGLARRVFGVVPGVLLTPIAIMVLTGRAASRSLKASTIPLWTRISLGLVLSASLQATILLAMPIWQPVVFPKVDATLLASAGAATAIGSTFAALTTIASRWFQREEKLVSYLMLSLAAFIGHLAGLIVSALAYSPLLAVWGYAIGWAVAAGMGFRGLLRQEFTDSKPSRSAAFSIVLALTMLLLLLASRPWALLSIPLMTAAATVQLMEVRSSRQPDLSRTGN